MNKIKLNLGEGWIAYFEIPKEESISDRANRILRNICLIFGFSALILFILILLK